MQLSSYLLFGLFSQFPSFPVFVLARPERKPNAPSRLVIDSFEDAEYNALGFYHGGTEAMIVNVRTGAVTVTTNEVDGESSSVLSLGESCMDFSGYTDHFLRLTYAGSNNFTISLLQHNTECDELVKPYPETWDSVDASRYVTAGMNAEIWVPMSHFDIDLGRLTAIRFEGFWTKQETRIHTVELVPLSKGPRRWSPPENLPSGKLALSCKSPGTFAFGIDDGAPSLAQEVMQVLKDEDIKVTFFVTGLALAYEETNFTNVYKEALENGHEIGLHSWHHSQLETLTTDAAIDDDFRRSVAMLEENLGITPTIFRPPYGSIGARMRQSFCRFVPDGETPILVKWSADVEDWIYGRSIPQDSELDKKPGTKKDKIERWQAKKQIEAFKRDLDRGGTIAVSHYIFKSTASILPDMIRLVREKELAIQTVSECLQEDSAGE